jgi:predicted nuclease of predicted toxin-antitoxin system
LGNEGHISLLGKGKAKYIEIIEMENENDKTIITQDLDYGSLLAFSNESKPSVLIFRIHQLSRKICFKLIQENWENIEDSLESGAVVIIEQESLRIRTLPIKKIINN